MLLLLSGSVQQQQLRETKTKLIPMGVNVMGFSPMGINTEAFDCVYIANDNHTSLAVKQNDEILEVNCGHGTLNLIVVNSNIGGGLDLYSTNWARLTRNKPPG